MCEITYRRKLREVRIVTGGHIFFCHEVSFIMYLPLDIEINEGLFIYHLGVMKVDRIKKHLLALTQSESSVPA